MRLFKEEKEFVSNEVSKKYSDKLAELKAEFEDKISEAILANPKIQSFVNTARNLIPVDKCEAYVWCSAVCISVAEKNEDRYGNKTQAELKFNTDEYFNVYKSPRDADYSNYSDIFLNIMMRTKAPKEEDDRFSVLTSMVDEIGQAILAKETENFTEDLSRVKTL